MFSLCFRCTIAAIPFVALVGCGSDSDSDDNSTVVEAPMVEHPGGGIDTNVDIGGPATGSSRAYPDGPYGLTVGSTIRDMKFWGFRDPEGAGYKVTEDSLTEIRLSDYYNPDKDPSKTFAILLNSSALWCTVCQREANDAKRFYPYWKAKGVELITTIYQDDDDDGPFPAEFCDIEWWARRFSAKYPVVVDPKCTMCVFYDQTATPYNMVIDTTEMKIVYGTVGYFYLDKNSTEGKDQTDLLEKYTAP